MNIEFLWETLFSLSGYNHLVTFSVSWFLMVRPKWYLFSHTHTHTCTHIHFVCFILDWHLKFWNWHGKLKEGRTWNRWIFFFWPIKIQPILDKVLWVWLREGEEEKWKHWREDPTCLYYLKGAKAEEILLCSTPYFKTQAKVEYEPVEKFF